MKVKSYCKRNKEWERCEDKTHTMDRLDWVKIMLITNWVEKYQIFNFLVMLLFIRKGKIVIVIYKIKQKLFKMLIIWLDKFLLILWKVFYLIKSIVNNILKVSNQKDKKMEVFFKIKELVKQVDFFNKVDKKLEIELILLKKVDKSSIQLCLS